MDIIKTDIEENSLKIEEKSLRPKWFSEYIGQNKAIDNLKVFVSASLYRDTPLDHILLYGMQGLGKTSLAYVIANEMGGKLRVTSAPAIEKTGELVSILASLNEHDVLFIDEIHRLNRTIEETLYSAMEDYSVDIIVGSDSQSKSIRINLPKFTLIGATTKAGMISAPLRDRFGISLKLDYYNEEDLADIIRRSAEILGVSIDKEGALVLARSSRGTPRIANNLLKRSIDFASELKSSTINREISSYTLERLGITKDGLSESDKRVLSVLSKEKPIGLSTLSCMIGEDKQTIEEVIEPYLIYKGYIAKTNKGRILV